MRSRFSELSSNCQWRRMACYWLCGTDVGPLEDLFNVSIGGIGGVEYPLDAPPMSPYMGKNTLDEPQVKPVEQFKNAITESEQLRKQKP